jgi:hypothetical protein
MNSPAPTADEDFSGGGHSSNASLHALMGDPTDATRRINQPARNRDIAGA